MFEASRSFYLKSTAQIKMHANHCNLKNREFGTFVELVRQYKLIRYKKKRVYTCALFIQQ